MQYNYSIIVPYRDKYDLFTKAIGSIPDRRDIQIIIVDNAPHPLPCSKVPQKQNAKVEYSTSSSSKGAGCARNEGLKHVEGKYLLFLDADDYFSTEAFAAFDNYIDKEFDIVFFKPTSIYLRTGDISDRHVEYSKMVDDYLITNDDRHLRFRWGVPWSKLFKTDFVLKGNYCFDELKVSNDTWFSIMTGYSARLIKADSNIVYVVTEGEVGQSLVKCVTKDNSLTRFLVAIRVNKFLKSTGNYDMRIRLKGFIRLAFEKFGLLEASRYLIIAIKNRVSIF